jgi:sensor domain CHASE-containing protein
MLASRPIVNSSGEGPIRGSLIFARFLNAEEVSRLSELTHLSLNIFSVKELSNLPDEQRAICKKLGPNKTAVCPVDKKTIVGYSLANDIYGKPAVALRVNIPREIHIYGLAAMKYLLISLVLAVMLFAVVMVMVIDRLVLVRIARLNRFAHSTLQELGIE